MPELHFSKQLEIAKDIESMNKQLEGFSRF